MAILNKKCACCSSRYSYCPSCSRQDALKPTYFDQFCSETCKDLWLTLTRYNMNRIIKSEAKSIISELDLKPIDSYVDCVQRDYAKVMAEEKKPKRNKRIEVQLVDEVTEVAEPVVEIKVEQPTEVAEVAEETTVHAVVLEEKE